MRGAGDRQRLRAPPLNLWRSTAVMTGSESGRPAPGRLVEPNDRSITQAHDGGRACRPVFVYWAPLGRRGAESARLTRRPSVRPDRAEAVGAVDGAVHPRPERHLGLVPALRAHDREVLAVRPVVAALVASRPADVTNVVAGIARCAAARATARAALRIRSEPLLRIELLVRRGVDELDSAVDAVEGSIDVDHDCLPGAWVWGAPAGGHRRGDAGSEGESGAATRVPMCCPRRRRTGVVSRQGYTTQRACKAGRPPVRRARGPVTIW